MVISLLSPRKFAIRTWSVSVLIIFSCLALSMSAAQVSVIQERCWFSQIDFFVKYLPHRINIVFLSSQFCHPHTQLTIILFHDEQRDIPNLEFSPNRAATRFSQIAFAIIVLPNDDHTDSAQEERLGLPYWTIILAICVVADESKCLDTPILEFSIICEHLPFLLVYELTLRLLLVHRNLAIWR